MERRVRGNSHARCGVGEKLEITSKVYLSLSNKAHMINPKKVILPCYDVFGSWDNSFRAYSAAEAVSDLELAMNYLVGDDEVWAKDVHNVMAEAEMSGQTKADCTFFEARFYKKGTMHLIFNEQGRRIIEKMNIFAARKRGWLPPSYGKKKYADMDEDERRVVDEFQGEKEYNKVVQNPQKYIVETGSLLQLGA